MPMTTTYRVRHLVENFFCRLKQYPAIATRSDKTRRNFFAAAYCAAMVILPTDDTL